MIEVPYLVKRALKRGTFRKNYRIIVLNDDGEVIDTIDNDDLVQESVRIDERMCSGSILKFGLCEGSSIEFSYAEHDNIRGRKIQVFIDVEYQDGQNNLWYPIPMGYFDIIQCSTQFSTGIIKAVGYNRLMSDYLDAAGNAILDTTFVDDQELTVFDIIYALLREYKVAPDFDKLSPDHQTHEGGLPTLEPTREIRKTLNLKFSQNYGIDAPLNYYEWYVKNSATAAPSRVYFNSRIFLYEDASQYLLPVFEHGDIEQFERDIYQRFVDEYDRAGFLDANNNAISGEEIMETFLQDQLWVSMFGIAVGSIIEETGDIADGNVYSTIQYNYNIANNLPIRSVQLPGENVTPNSCNIYPLKEATSRTFYDKTVRFLIPTVFGLYNSSPLKLMTFDIDGYNHPGLRSNQYTYYEDATMTTTATGEVEPFLLPDGTRLDDRDSTSAAEILVMTGIPVSDLPSGYKVTMSIADAPDFTLREVQSAVFETLCQFGQLDRVTDLFSGVELNNGGLYPRNDLYPADDLYPNEGYPENNLHPFPSEYEKLWTDTVGAQSFKYLIITYKTTEEDGEGNVVEVEKTLQRTVNPNGTTNYNMSDNWLFKSFVWTYQEVEAYAEAMLPKLRVITWFPFEMWAAGLPYVETGDLIEITDKQNQTYTSYILQRQLIGIQKLMDTYINGELEIF